MISAATQPPKQAPTRTASCKPELGGEVEIEIGEIIDRADAVDQRGIAPARMARRDHPIAAGEKVEPRPLRHQPFAGVQKQQWPAGAALDQFEAGAGDGNRARHYGAG